MKLTITIAGLPVAYERTPQGALVTDPAWPCCPLVMSQRNRARDGLAPDPMLPEPTDACVAGPLVLGLLEESHDHDTSRGAVIARCCWRMVGDYVLHHETLFGIEEDRAVAARARVYR